MPRKKWFSAKDCHGMDEYRNIPEGSILVIKPERLKKMLSSPIPNKQLVVATGGFGLSQATSSPSIFVHSLEDESRKYQMHRDDFLGVLKQEVYEQIEIYIRNGTIIEFS